MNIYSYGVVLIIFAIGVPVVSAAAGIELIWTGLEGKRWWPLRLLIGAPLAAFGIFGIIYMTL